jgi:HD-GYP domain-containing protein (c-di-GMP phosphodiesterase class II)
MTKLLVQKSVVTSEAQLRMSDLISALSLALDLTEGQPMGHAVKSCLLGMRVADILQLSVQTRSDLYYALLLKDAGCSSNAARMFEIFGGDERAAKKEVKTTDWSRITFEGLEYLMRNVMPGRSRLDRVIAIAQIAIRRKEQSTELFQLRCERGGQIAKKIGLSEATTNAIYCLDEHWDGNGFPHQLKGSDIPLLSRVMNLCQTLEVFIAVSGVQDAFDVIQGRSGTWFDPEIVRASLELQHDEALWASFDSDDVREKVIQIEPTELFQYADDPRIDSVCEAFADVIDVKSPYTHAHSKGVTSAAVAIAATLGLEQEEIRIIGRAALLHDIGKLSVPNSILDKNGKLTAQEWETVRLHPYYTQRILERISGFKHLAFIASSHHEKLDGSGYYRNLRATQLPMAARAITTADIYDALSAKRPYRDALPTEKVLEIMAADVPHALDQACFEALKTTVHQSKPDPEPAVKSKG